MMQTFFKNALPVWGVGLQEEMNCFLRFETAITEKSAHIVIAACNVYRIFVNDVFVGDGPARAAHGFYRVDEIDLDRYLNSINNKIVIEVGAYRVNSYQYLDEPGFLQCEIRTGEKVLAATGKSDFSVTRMEEKLQKVQRYSFQRTFCEEYVLPSQHKTVELEIVSEKRLLQRGVPGCDYEPLYLQKNLVMGKVTCGNSRKTYSIDRYVANISPKFKGYPISKLESFVTKEVEEMDFLIDENQRTGNIFSFDGNQYGIYEFPYNATGLLCVDVEIGHDTVLYFVFDEILVNGEVDFLRLTSANVIKYHLKPGRYCLQSFEPYTMKYLKVIAIGGSGTVKNMHLKQVRGKIESTNLDISDSGMKEIYQAAVESFCQNAVDIYMDCPSRERAGWLCDSFFTGRVEYLLTGKSRIEKNFLENYLLAEKFEYLPDGMLPMCYPADHTDGVFIPNWAMWFVLELEEYKNRTGDTQWVLKFEKRVRKLVEYFLPFENEEGLLEDLEGWIFVEWSKCNDLVDGVNYPTNMVYAAMLEAAARLFSEPSWYKKAQKIKETIRGQAFDGTFFREHAIRENGVLTVQNDITETGQYYAFFFRIVSPEKNQALWNLLLQDFGPERKKNGKHPDVSYSNAFIGNYLRLSLLKEYGHRHKLEEEIKRYFFYMAERTGTLWEHDSVTASCDHGFASYVLCLLDKKNDKETVLISTYEAEQ